jgi:filamentous hemagglutinin family protein
MLSFFQGQGALQAADLPQVLTGVNARFTGADAPVVTGNDMVINQFAERATLHWQSFNIGAGNSVEFVQPSTSSVALNRIFDAVPSEIAGRLTANGQVYLINQNGILFTSTAQVNTQSLVASTLDIDDLVFEEIGFVNAINEQPNALAAFDSFGQPMGEIRIEDGAVLESESTGRILIFAPSIVNEGTIRTPDGQAVLAASEDQVFIAASQDADLRGLLVEVNTGGDVTNVGELIAERGNISLLGLAVNQNGVARATTSVSLNGSIRLVAQDMDGTPTFRGTGIFEPRRPVANRGGDLVLGEGSVTEVIPDTSVDENGEAIVAFDAQAQSRSVVDLAATRVLLESGSRVTSTGGNLDVIAADNPSDLRLLQTGDPDLLPIELRVEAGAVLDVAGDQTTSVAMERNVIEVEARGNELADSPVQRDGPIRNETLRVDLRRGTEFLDTSGAEGSIGRTASERQSPGCSITIRSEGAVVAEVGSLIDVSGGQVAYRDGVIATSQLRQANGRVVEISSADPDQQYTGVAPDAVRQEAGYIEGKDAGQLNIGARGITLDGQILGVARVGVNQRLAPQALGLVPVFNRPFDQSPLGGTLSLNLLRAGLPDIVVGSDPGGSPAVPPVIIPVDTLGQSGVTQLVLQNAGDVLVSESFELPAFGSVSLAGTGVQVLRDIRIAGGTV